MLDPDAGGRWSISPSDESKVTRRYLDKTNVLETTFSTSTAKIVLSDFMPVTSEERFWRHRSGNIVHPPAHRSSKMFSR